MKELFHLADDFLRGRGRFAVDAPARGRVAALLLLTLIFGAVYGAAMGSFGLCVSGEKRLLAYTWMVALKAPMLLLITYALCMPSFYVINAVMGLHADFGRALRAVTGTLACLSLTLASLAPVTLFFYFCTGFYDAAILFNGLIFAVASFASIIVVRRYYGPLIRTDPRHGSMMAIWFALYIFVAIQMAWTLRPFIGDPNPAVPIVFLRSGEIDNAYLEVIRLFGQVLRAWGPG
jgi:hypothetical protein